MRNLLYFLYFKLKGRSFFLIKARVIFTFLHNFDTIWLKLWKFLQQTIFTFLITPVTFTWNIKGIYWWNEMKFRLIKYWNFKLHHNHLFRYQMKITVWFSSVLVIPRQSGGAKEGAGLNKLNSNCNSKPMCFYYEWPVKMVGKDVRAWHRMINNWPSVRWLCSASPTDWI